MWRFVCLIVLSALAGCGSRPPAPVVERSTPVQVEGARGGFGVASANSRDGHYVVKKGDNLYRIAIAHGVTPQDISAWNNFTATTKLEVGQDLRVTPPDGVVEVRAISAPAPIVVMGDGSTSSAGNAPVAATTPGSSTLEREPKGGKIPYSESALAQVRAMEGAQASARSTTQPAPASTTSTSAPGPTSGSTSAPGAAPGSTSASGSTSNETDGIDWTWPVAGKTIRGFGKNGGGEISRGIDIMGRMGEPIIAAASGKVSYVGSLKDYGDFVVVRHEAEYLSVYAHTSKILVKEGQSVSRGQKIAEVGSSGVNQTKLHFEIRHKSEPVDPVKLLPARQ